MAEVHSLPAVLTDPGLQTANFRKGCLFTLDSLRHRTLGRWEPSFSKHPCSMQALQGKPQLDAETNDHLRIKKTANLQGQH